MRALAFAFRLSFLRLSILSFAFACISVSLAFLCLVCKARAIPGIYRFPNLHHFVLTHGLSCIYLCFWFPGFGVAALYIAFGRYNQTVNGVLILDQNIDVDVDV